MELVGNFSSVQIAAHTVIPQLVLNTIERWDIIMLFFFDLLHDLLFYDLLHDLLFR